MSNEAINWAMSLTDLTSTEKFVLVAYANRAGKTMKAWPSKKCLQKDTSLALKPIYNAIKSLITKGYMIKTGEIEQVPVYQLVGVKTPEKLSTTPSQFTRGEDQKLSTTPSQFTTPPPSRSTGGTPSRSTTRNHNKNQKKRKNEEKDFSFFSFFSDFCRRRLQEMAIDFDEDLIDQILYYAKTSEHKRDAKDSCEMAFAQLKKKRWNIPHGWRGVTSQSIREQEEQQQREKEQQWADESKAAQSIFVAIDRGKGLEEVSKIREILYGTRANGVATDEIHDKIESNFRNEQKNLKLHRSLLRNF